MNIAELKFLASGVSSFLGDVKKAQKAEEDLAATAKRAEGETGDAAKKAAKEVAAAALVKEQAAKRASLALTALSGIATGIFVAGITKAVKGAMSFEDALDQVGAVAQATTKEMESLRKEALQIGADTSFSANDAAKAMHELAAGGRSVAQIMGGEARAAVGLAEAGNYGLAESAKTIATAMDIWKDTQIETNDVVNRLAGAANTSRFGVEDMSSAIAQGGGVAAQAGVSFQDFTTVIAATASSFASGSDAGTSFKTFITSLSGSSQLAKDKIAELGLSFYDAQGAIRPMADIVQQLHDKLGPLSQEQQTVALKTIFGNDAFRTAASLMKLTGSEFDGMSAKMKNTSAIDVAAQRMGNASGGMEQLRGSIETVSISLGQQFIPAITETLGFVTKLVNKFGELPSSIKNIAVFGSLLVAAIPLIISFVNNLGNAVTTMKNLAAASLGAKVALGVGGFLGTIILVDQMLDQFTEHGLFERLFGDVDRSNAAREALDAWELKMARLPEDADRGKIAIDDLYKSLENPPQFMEDKGGDKGGFWGGLDRLVDNLSSMTGNDKLGDLFTWGDQQKQIDTVDDLIERTKEYQEQLRVWGSAALAAGVDAETLYDAYQKIPEPFRESFLNADQFKQVLKELSDQGVARQAKEIEGMAQATEFLSQVIGGPGLKAIKTYSTAWADFIGFARDAETGVVDFGAVIEKLNSRFAAGNPEVASMATRIAAYKDELAEMNATGVETGDTFGLTREQLEGLIKELEVSSAAYASNAEVMEAVGHQIELQAGPEGWAKLNFALQGSTLSFNEQADAAVRVTDGLNLIASGSLDQAIDYFSNMKEQLKDQPELWAAIATVVGPEMAQKLAQSISQGLLTPEQVSSISGSISTLFAEAVPQVDTSSGAILAATWVDSLSTSIAGAEMKKLVQAKGTELLGALEAAENRPAAEAAATKAVADFANWLPAGPNHDKAVADFTTLVTGMLDTKFPEETQAAADNLVDSTATGLTTEENKATITGALEETLDAGLANAKVDMIKANKLGSSLVEGIIAGIQTQQPNLNEVVAGIMTSGVGAGETVLDSNSPSRLTRDVLGIPLVEGIVVGMEKMAPGMYEGLRTLLRNSIAGAKAELSAGLADIGNGGLGGDTMVPEGYWFTPSGAISETPEHRAARLQAELSQAQADALRTLSLQLDENLATNTEMGVEAIKDMIAQIEAVLENDDIPSALKKQAEESIKAWREALEKGEGVANAEVRALTGNMRIALDNSLHEQETKLEHWMRTLGLNLQEAHEMGTTEIEQMFLDMLDAMDTAGFDEALRDEITKAIQAMHEALVAGRGVANADVQAIVAEVQAGVAAAKAAAYLATQAFKPTNDPNVSNAPYEAKQNQDLAQRQAAAAAMGVSLEEYDAYIAKQRARPEYASMGEGSNIQHGQSAIGAYILQPDGSLVRVPEGTYDPSGNGGRGMWFWNGAWQSNPPPTAAPGGGYYGESTGVGAANYELSPAQIADIQQLEYGLESSWGMSQAEREKFSLLGVSAAELDAIASRVASDRSLAPSLRDGVLQAIELIRSTGPGSPTYHGESLTGGYGSGGNAPPSSGYGTVTGFAHGTDFVPADMLAFLHRGEAVIPAWMNEGMSDLFTSFKGWFSKQTGGLFGFDDVFNEPLLTRRPVWGDSRGGGISFQPGSLIVNYSGPAENARQVGEDFGEALMRTLRVSGSRV